jgi:hypothetical protein
MVRHLATLDTNTLLGSMKEALTFHDKKWKEKANERKSYFYLFSTRRIPGANFLVCADHIQDYAR